MQRMTMAHRISNTLIAIVVSYALGVLMMILAFIHSTGYRPPLSEYFVVPLILGYQNPLVAGMVVGLSLVLVHLCWTAAAQRRSR